MSSVVLVFLVVVVFHLMKLLTGTELEAISWFKVLHQLVSGSVYVFFELFDSLQKLV